MLSVITTLLLFVLIIGLVVMIHELGHFWAAKVSDMEVEEFAFGFGPKLFSRKMGETEYMIKLFPIGGYVKILGEEEDVKDPRSFSEKPIKSRILVAISGVIMNVLLAAVVFYGVLWAQDFTYQGIPYYDDFRVVFGEQVEVTLIPATVVEIEEDSSLYELNLPVPFEVLSVDAVPVTDTEELQEQLVSHAGETVSLEIRKEEGSNVREVEADVSEDGKLGVYLAADLKVWEIQYNGTIDRVFSGFYHTVNMGKANFFILGKLFQQAFEEKTITPVAQTVSGPIGIIAIVDMVKKFGGVLGIFDLIAVLSLTLAMMNILPLPALDGGHVVLLAIEGIRGRPVNIVAQRWIMGGGLIVFFILMIVVSAKDFFQFGVWDWLSGVLGV